MTPATEDGNPTTPGRITLDLDENDMKEVDEIAEQLMGHACVVDVKSEYVKSTISAYVLAKKWLNALECNAFVAPCPDACSTRRLHELNFTFCMTQRMAPRPLPVSTRRYPFISSPGRMANSRPFSSSMMTAREYLV